MLHRPECQCRCADCLASATGPNRRGFKLRDRGGWIAPLTAFRNTRDFTSPIRASWWHLHRPFVLLCVTVFRVRRAGRPSSRFESITVIGTIQDLFPRIPVASIDPMRQPRRRGSIRTVCAVTATLLRCAGTLPLCDPQCARPHHRRYRAATRSSDRAFSRADEGNARLRSRAGPQAECGFQSRGGDPGYDGQDGDPAATRRDGILTCGLTAHIAPPGKRPAQSRISA